MEPPRRRNRSGELKREEIRRAAYECFRDSGYHETTVDAICLKAGASKGSFYWHYQSKQEVFIDILDTWTREVMDQLYEQFEEAVLDADYVTAVTQALEREVHRGRVILPLWLEFIVQAQRDPEIRAAVAKFHRRARAAIAAIIRPALASRCTEAEIQAVATTTFGAYVGLMMQDVSDPGHADAPSAVTTFMALLGDWESRERQRDAN
jgi:AcrR family transcriptional regulator